MKTSARWLGIVLQGVILGTLLFLAITQLLGLHQGARVFRYQGF